MNFKRLMIGLGLAASISMAQAEDPFKVGFVYVGPMVIMVGVMNITVAAKKCRLSLATRSRQRLLKTCLKAQMHKGSSLNWQKPATISSSLPPSVL